LSNLASKGDKISSQGLRVLKLSTGKTMPTKKHKKKKLKKKKVKKTKPTGYFRGAKKKRLK